MWTRCPKPARTTGRRNRCGGFTLIEASITTVIIGVGVLALMELLASGTISNASSTRQTTATNLANNINEWSLRVPYGELFATFNNKNFTTPRNARGLALANFSGWSQVVDVQYVNPDRITVAVADSQLEPTARVSVDVQFNAKTVYSTSWIVTASEWPPPP